MTPIEKVVQELDERAEGIDKIVPSLQSIGKPGAIGNRGQRDLAGAELTGGYLTKHLLANIRNQGVVRGAEWRRIRRAASKAMPSLRIANKNMTSANAATGYDVGGTVQVTNNPRIANPSTKTYEDIQGDAEAPGAGVNLAEARKDEGQQSRPQCGAPFAANRPLRVAH